MNCYKNIYLINIYLKYTSWVSHIVTDVDSSKPSDANIRQKTTSPFVQIMACCLFGDKPLSEEMMDYHQLDPWEQISVKFESK